MVVLRPNAQRPLYSPLNALQHPAAMVSRRINVLLVQMSAC